MKRTPVQPALGLYLAQGRDGTERHLSLVPYVVGVDALCGAPLRHTRAVPSPEAVGFANCRICVAVARDLRP